MITKLGLFEFTADFNGLAIPRAAAPKPAADVKKSRLLSPWSMSIIFAQNCEYGRDLAALCKETKRTETTYSHRIRDANLNEAAQRRTLARDIIWQSNCRVADKGSCGEIARVATLPHCAARFRLKTQ